MKPSKSSSGLPVFRGRFLVTLVSFPAVAFRLDWYCRRLAFFASSSIFLDSGSIHKI
jgi:hypothetical protein